MNDTLFLVQKVLIG